MKKGLIIISSVLLGLSSSLFFAGCGGKDTDSDLSSWAMNEQDATNAVDKPRIDFTRMPLYFIANKGQVNEKAKYYAKASRYTLWLTGEGLVFDQASLPKKERIDGAGAESENPRRDVSSLVFVNANPDPAMMAVAETGHQVSYFIGNDPAKWHRNIPTSKAVLYQDLYQGIDLKVYGVEKQIEYDWIVKPGEDPGAISFAYQGVKGTRIDAVGNLLIETAGGELIHNRPLTYQDIDGVRVSVQAEYKQTGENRYGFIVGEYDKNHQLIIDPVVLLYSTCLGGRGDDHGYGIAADNNGNVYVTGTTWSLDFPTRSPYQTDPDIRGSEDVFVSKINTTAQWGANSLVFSTYLGGGGTDYGYGIAADASGNVYVTGSTYSTDFPTRNPYQTDQPADDVFVTKIDTNQSGAASLVYSTYLGGGSIDDGKGIAADDSGNVYVTGSTYSTDFPTRNPYQTDQPADDVFVTKIDTNQSGDASLVYSTYLGGGNVDQGYGIAADISGNVYVTGWTGSTDFPTRNPYQTDQPAADAFVTKIDTNQSGDASLVYSTYLGGGDWDQSNGIAADISGNVYVTGWTGSTDFPTRNPYQTDKAYVDVFVTKIDTTQIGANGLVYSTYLGGGSYDWGYGIAADDSGNVYVTGITESTDFPTRYPYQTDRRFGDAFVTKIDSTRIGAVSLVYSTYLGGDNDDTSLGLYGDGGYGIAADDSGNVYVTGITGSSDFPTKNPFQGYLGGTSEAFVTKLSFSEPTPEPTPVPVPVQTEQWKLILDNDQGKANITLTEQYGTVNANGTWEYTFQGMKSSGPFTGAPVTISGKSIVITATGTATSPTAPPGYTTSPYTLIINGTAFDRKGSGTFMVTFQSYGWPDTISGNWGGARTSGSGITAVKAKALPWLMLLLKD